MYNKPLLRKTLGHLCAHPEEWDQHHWAKRTPCGTVGCVAGNALIISGWDLLWETREGSDDVEVADECAREGRERSLIGVAARHELGLDADEADYLFDMGRTLDEIRVFITRLLESED